MPEFNSTKKMLVEYSISEGKEQGLLEGVKKSFIFPAYINEKYSFVSIPNLKVVEYGFVAYVGTAVTADALFRKVIDTTSLKILPSVEWREIILNNYIEKLADQKIGSVVKVSFRDPNHIELEKVLVPYEPESKKIDIEEIVKKNFSEDSVVKKVSENKPT